MKFNYDYATHQWVLSIMVGFFLSKVITTLAKHISNRENTTFYLPYYLLYQRRSRVLYLPTHNLIIG